MAGKAEITGDRPGGHLVDAPGQTEKNQGPRVPLRSRLFARGRLGKMVPSLTEESTTPVVTASPAQQDRLIPSHQPGEDAVFVAPAAESSGMNQRLYVFRDVVGMRAVLITGDEEENDQPDEGSQRGDRAADTITAGLHPAFYAAKAFYERQAREEAAREPLPGGDGDDGPPDDTDRSLEAGDPDSPINRAKQQLTETLREHGVTPDSATFAILNEKATYAAYTSLRVKVAHEQDDTPNDMLVDAIETAFADSIKKLKAYNESHPVESDTATGILAAILPKYEEAVRETDDSLPPRDVRIRAASLVGVHMDEMVEEPTTVYAQEPEQQESKEAPEATGETFAQMRERLTKLVRSSDINSPKLDYLRKYAFFYMQSKIVREQRLSGDTQAHVAATTLRELRDVFDSHMKESTLADYTLEDIVEFFDKGIFPLYKQAARQELGEPNYQSRDSIKQEAALETAAARQIHTDLEEIVSEIRSEDKKEEGFGEHPFAKAQEKLLGEYLGGDWVGKPLLAEILKLQLRISQAEIPGLKAIIARERNQLPRTDARIEIEKSIAKRAGIHAQFIRDVGWKWMTQRGMHPYDFYAALWEGEEVYWAYVKAAEEADPPTDHGMIPYSQVRISAASMFKRDVTPITLTQNILKIRGQIWDMLRFPRY